MFGGSEVSHECACVVGVVGGGVYPAGVAVLFVPCGCDGCGVCWCCVDGCERSEVFACAWFVLVPFAEYVVWSECPAVGACDVLPFGGVVWPVVGFCESWCVYEAWLAL